MKKIALAAAAASMLFAGAASAADLGARPYTKARRRRWSRSTTGPASTSVP